MAARGTPRTEVAVNAADEVIVAYDDPVLDDAEALRLDLGSRELFAVVRRGMLDVEMIRIASVPEDHLERLRAAGEAIVVRMDGDDQLRGGVLRVEVNES